LVKPSEAKEGFMTRHQLYEMIERIPDSEVPRLGKVLQDFLDDEEELTPADIEAIRAARRDIANGEVFSREEVMAELGLTDEL